MRYNVLYLTTLVYFFVNIECARILGVVPTPSYSHQVLFRPIWNELALKGHDVVVLTTDPVNNASLTNLKEIDLHGAYNHWTVSKMTEQSSLNIMKIMKEMMAVISKVEEFEFQHPEVQALIKNETEHFDLLVAEFLFPSMLAFGTRFNCNYIGIVSMDAPMYAHHIMGNPTNPVVYPDFQLPLVPPLNFLERVISVVFRFVLEIVGMFLIMPMEDAIIKKYFGQDFPNLYNIVENISMLFLNTNPILHPVRPLGPTTIQIGGGTHLTPPKELPKDLKLFLDNAKEGVVYFSLGSNVKSTSINPSLRQVILETLKSLPYKVLWKFDVEVPDKPDNVKIISWGPQQDILRHPNIKVFVTQGGLQSTEEAIHSHVPMVSMPFFGDQMANAKIIENKGLGIVVDRYTLDKGTFTKAILEVINNPKYKATVEELAEIMSDQQVTGVEKAVWWIEYVIRHKGAHHLRSHVYRVPFYQYYCLDVLAFLTILVFIVFKLFKVTLKKLFSLFKTSKVKTN